MTRHKFTWRHVVRRILSLVFSRLVVTGVLLLAQLVWFFILFSRLSEYATWINGAGIAHQRHHVPGAHPAGFHRAGVQDQLDDPVCRHAGAGRAALPAVGRQTPRAAPAPPVGARRGRAGPAAHRRPPPPSKNWPRATPARPRPRATCGILPPRRCLTAPPCATTRAARRCSPTCWPRWKAPSTASMSKVSSSAWARCGAASMRSCAARPPPASTCA